MVVEFDGVVCLFVCVCVCVFVCLFVASLLSRAAHRCCLLGLVEMLVWSCWSFIMDLELLEIVLVCRCWSLMDSELVVVASHGLCLFGIVGCLFRVMLILLLRRWLHACRIHCAQKGDQMRCVAESQGLYLEVTQEEHGIQSWFA